MSETRSLPYNSSHGMTLVEMLITSAVLTLIAGGIFTLLNQSQRSFHSQQNLTEVVQQARIAMDQITTSIQQAGNDPEDALGSTSPIEILGTGHIRINSDLTGSITSGAPIDGRGDPNGNLVQRYERVVIRYDSGANNLYMDIGDGEAVLADNITTFNLTFYDMAGNTTGTESDIARVHVEFVAESEDPDLETGKIQTITLQSDIMLRSKAFDVFE